MKSSYELAMERLGGASKKLTDDQKARIAEIDSRYRAKIAEIRLKSKEEMSKTANPEEDDKILAQIAGRIQELERKCEKEKDKVREE